MEFRAVFPNPFEKLSEIAVIPGQYVPVDLTVGEDPNTTLVPGPALAESRKVEVGQAYQQQWIIKKGLKKGERVIYDGLQKIRPGMVVMHQG